MLIAGLCCVVMEFQSLKTVDCSQSCIVCSNRIAEFKIGHSHVRLVLSSLKYCKW